MMIPRPTSGSTKLGSILDRRVSSKSPHDYCSARATLALYNPSPPSRACLDVPTYSLSQLDNFSNCPAGILHCQARTTPSFLSVVSKSTRHGRLTGSHSPLAATPLMLTPTPPQPWSRKFLRSFGFNGTSPFPAPSQDRTKRQAIEWRRSRPMIGDRFNQSGTSILGKGMLRAEVDLPSSSVILGANQHTRAPCRQMR